LKERWQDNQQPLEAKTTHLATIRSIDELDPTERMWNGQTAPPPCTHQCFLWRACPPSESSPCWFDIPCSEWCTLRGACTLRGPPMKSDKKRISLRGVTFLFRRLRASSFSRSVSLSLFSLSFPPVSSLRRSFSQSARVSFFRTPLVSHVTSSLVSPCVRRAQTTRRKERFFLIFSF
jgi:hypothetical protein